MAQFGLNAGAQVPKSVPGQRSACVLGYAVSYTKQLDEQTCTVHDQDIIAMTGLIWSIIRAIVLSDVTAHVQQCLANIKMPEMGMQYVKSGKSAVSRIVCKI